MDATDLETFVDALIDDLTPVAAREGDRPLFHLLDAPRRGVDDEAVVAVLAAAVTLRNLADHVIASAVVAAERAAIPARQHLRTGTDLLTSIGVAPGAAHRAVRVGRAAHTLPALTAQQRLGAVGIEFADAVGKGISHITSRVALSEEDRAEIVTTLMTQTTPSLVDKKARGIAITKAATSSPEEGAVPVAENTDLNDMTVVQTEDGRVAATLDLDALTGEELLAALDPLTRPIPLPDGSPDPRPVGRRRADAFGQILRTYLSGSGRPMSGGVLPHVTLIRPATQGVDTLGFGGPISTATAELIACDSTLTSVIVDHSGAPLDVGRSERLFTPLIRKGLAVRDGGCAHPGCGRPVSWCDAHHITPWSAGGTTSLDNGVLLCRLHHTAIHHGGWQVYLGPDRHPWFIPPHAQGTPTPEHLRSHARRTMTDLPTAA
ncbi:hypothetical protein A7U43_00270 [Mycobacterium adipatum]|jgi:hypothetical protein|uniref:HNH nuclease domain-containing protein n=2 Tax=Mycobacterium adipatum TaxID=1682113 RepID=A0A172UFR7_9MYCO|nr:HNH endonuclease signature motif containing protein [Mycobacterium adipatum]ANE77967.1 hypothetical protein A7U43_00270 [Mycobacterium adipatum]MBI5738598.1 DUF222 domain-containing protein [Mycolicibacterium neoaurum]